MALTFPIRQSSPLPEVAQACIDLVPKLQRAIDVVRGYTIGTSETAVAHGLGVVPLTVVLSPYSNVTWWQTKTPDSKHVFLAASASAVCDVAVIA